MFSTSLSLYLSLYLSPSLHPANNLSSVSPPTGDGFMLNMLSVTQILNQKVKVEKVDPFYPFHPAARTPKPGADDTRLLLTPADADEWVENGIPALVPANWKEVRMNN